MSSEAPIVEPPANQPSETEASKSSEPGFESELGNVKNSQVAIGHGAIVTTGGLTLQAMVPGAVPITVQGLQCTLCVQPRPVSMCQPRPELLDRERERLACFTRTPTIIELFGDEGIGKSTLLSFLAHDLPSVLPDSYLDGVAYLNAEESSFDELRLDVWSLFYFYQATVPGPVIPTEGEQNFHLREIGALLLIDDARLNENEARTLNTIMSKSTMILSREHQEIFSFGKSIPLSRLPSEYMRRLAEIQLERLGLPDCPIPEDVLAHYWAEYDGNLFRIVREVSAWAQSATNGLPVGVDLALASTVTDVVRALEKPAPEDVLEAVIGPGASGTAEKLASSGDLKSHSPRYTCPWPRNDVSPALAEEYRSRALKYVAEVPNLTERPDLYPLALHLLKWSSWRPNFKSEAITIAHRLSDAFMTAGYWDRWDETLRAAARMANVTGDGETSAWALHNLGAAALCHGNFVDARQTLQVALQMRITNKATTEAIDATRALLSEAVARVRANPEAMGGSVATPPVPRAPRPGSGTQARKQPELVRSSKGRGIDDERRPGPRTVREQDWQRKEQPTRRRARGEY
jgi:hypothetical protein